MSTPPTQTHPSPSPSHPDTETTTHPHNRNNTNTDTVDLSECQTTRAAAQQIYVALLERATHSQIRLYTPDHAHHLDSPNAWIIEWDGGPHRWNHNLAQGRSIYHSLHELSENTRRDLDADTHPPHPDTLTPEISGIDALETCTITPHGPDAIAISHTE